MKILEPAYKEPIAMAKLLPALNKQSKVVDNGIFKSEFSGHFPFPLPRHWIVERITESQ
jgi:hypothetical protein